MIGGYLLKQLNVMREADCLCDLELISSNGGSFKVHHIVFVALNPKHREQYRIVHDDGTKWFPRADKKMLLNMVTTEELKVVVEFIYGVPVTLLSRFDVLKNALKKLSMNHLLDEVEDFQFQMDEVLMKAEPEDIKMEITDTEPCKFEQPNTISVNAETENVSSKGTPVELFPTNYTDKIDMNHDDETLVKHEPGTVMSALENFIEKQIDAAFNESENVDNNVLDALRTVKDKIFEYNQTVQCQGMKRDNNEPHTAQGNSNVIFTTSTTDESHNSEIDKERIVNKDSNDFIVESCTTIQKNKESMVRDCEKKTDNSVKCQLNLNNGNIDTANRQMEVTSQTSRLSQNFVNIGSNADSQNVLHKDVKRKCSNVKANRKQAFINRSYIIRKEMKKRNDKHQKECKPSVSLGINKNLESNTTTNSTNKRTDREIRPKEDTSQISSHPSTPGQQPSVLCFPIMQAAGPRKMIPQPKQLTQVQFEKMPPKDSKCVNLQYYIPVAELAQSKMKSPNKSNVQNICTLIVQPKEMELKSKDNSNIYNMQHNQNWIKGAKTEQSNRANEDSILIMQKAESSKNKDDVFLPNQNSSQPIEKGLNMIITSANPSICDNNDNQMDEKSGKTVARLSEVGVNLSQNIWSKGSRMSNDNPTHCKESNMKAIGREKQCDSGDTSSIVNESMLPVSNLNDKTKVNNIQTETNSCVRQNLPVSMLYSGATRNGCELIQNQTTAVTIHGSEDKQESSEISEQVMDVTETIDMGEIYELKVDKETVDNPESIVEKEIKDGMYSNKTKEGLQSLSLEANLRKNVNLKLELPEQKTLIDCQIQQQYPIAVELSPTTTYNVTKTESLALSPNAILTKDNSAASNKDQIGSIVTNKPQKKLHTESKKRKPITLIGSKSVLVKLVRLPDSITSDRSYSIHHQPVKNLLKHKMKCKDGRKKYNPTKNMAHKSFVAENKSPKEMYTEHCSKKEIKTTNEIGREITKIYDIESDQNGIQWQPSFPSVPCTQDISKQNLRTFKRGRGRPRLNHYRNNSRGYFGTKMPIVTSSGEKTTCSKSTREILPKVTCDLDILKLGMIGGGTPEHQFPKGINYKPTLKSKAFVKGVADDVRSDQLCPIDIKQSKAKLPRDGGKSEELNSVSKQTEHTYVMLQTSEIITKSLTNSEGRGSLSGGLQGSSAKCVNEKVENCEHYSKTLKQRGRGRPKSTPLQINLAVHLDKRKITPTPVSNKVNRKIFPKPTRKIAPKVSCELRLPVQIPFKSDELLKPFMINQSNLESKGYRQSIQSILPKGNLVFLNNGQTGKKNIQRKRSKRSKSMEKPKQSKLSQNELKRPTVHNEDKAGSKKLASLSKNTVSDQASTSMKLQDQVLIENDKNEQSNCEEEITPSTTNGNVPGTKGIILPQDIILTKENLDVSQEQNDTLQFENLEQSELMELNENHLKLLEKQTMEMNKTPNSQLELNKQTCTLREQTEFGDVDMAPPELDFYLKSVDTSDKNRTQSSEDGQGDSYNDIVIKQQPGHSIMPSTEKMKHDHETLNRCLILPSPIHVYENKAAASLADNRRSTSTPTQVIAPSIPLHSGILAQSLFRIDTIEQACTDSEVKTSTIKTNASENEIPDKTSSSIQSCGSDIYQLKELLHANEGNKQEQQKIGKQTKAPGKTELSLETIDLNDNTESDIIADVNGHIFDGDNSVCEQPVKKCVSIKKTGKHNYETLKMHLSRPIPAIYESKSAAEFSGNKLPIITPTRKLQPQLPVTVDVHRDNVLDNTTKRKLDKSTKRKLDKITKRKLDNTAKQKLDNTTKQKLDKTTKRKLDKTTKRKLDKITKRELDITTKQKLDNTTKQKLDNTTKQKSPNSNIVELSPAGNCRILDFEAIKESPQATIRKDNCDPKIQPDLSFYNKKTMQHVEEGKSSFTPKATEYDVIRLSPQSLMSKPTKCREIHSPSLCLKLFQPDETTYHVTVDSNSIKTFQIEDDNCWEHDTGYFHLGNKGGKVLNPETIAITKTCSRTKCELYRNCSKEMPHVSHNTKKRHRSAEQNNKSARVRRNHKRISLEKNVVGLKSTKSNEEMKFRPSASPKHCVEKHKAINELADDMSEDESIPLSVLATLNKKSYEKKVNFNRRCDHESNVNGTFTACHVSESTAANEDKPKYEPIQNVNEIENNENMTIFKDENALCMSMCQTEGIQMMQQHGSDSNTKDSTSKRYSKEQNEQFVKKRRKLFIGKRKTLSFVQDSSDVSEASSTH